MVSILHLNRVPAIRIASAVVTNRGGRTCHAGELRNVVLFKQYSVLLPENDVLLLACWFG